MKKPVTEGAFVFPGAQIAGDVTLAPDVSVWYNAVLRGDEAPIAVGRGSNIQDGCVLHVDEGRPVTVGEGVTVGHGCILHGCTVGDHALVGMGSILLNGAVLGDHCLLGAGSLVTEGTVIPAGMLAFGRPAKPVRELTREEMEKLERSAEKYVERAKGSLSVGLEGMK